jgi:hypothetical protein
MRMWTVLFAGLAAWLAPGGTARAAESEASRPEPGLFAFVLPWDDATASVTDLSGWLHRPAGRFGRVRAGEDGRYYAGDQRLRFFGVNFCFGANFPRPDDAVRVAARMAKFGINCARLHHMDMRMFPDGIRARGRDDTRELDSEALERLDYFVAQLKQQGIYVNLNLLVSRPFNAADGLPAEIEQLGWKDQHVVGFFHAPMIELQKEFARKLLTRRNRHTGLTWAEDPAIAFVEINNENGLIHAWLGGKLERLPEVFARELQRQWNDWLRRRHGSTEKLRAAWQARDTLPGAEMLRAGPDHWRLEQHAGAVARVAPGADTDPPGAVRITVTEPGAQAWHVQYNQPGLSLKAGQAYTVAFRARAEARSVIEVNVGQARSPWELLGLDAPVELSTEWRSFRFTFNATADETDARLNFTGLGRQRGSWRLADISLRPGGVTGLAADARIEAGTVPLVLRRDSGGYNAEAQRDWIRFLWDTERGYWQQLRRYLKDELQSQAVIIGTIIGCSTPNLMAEFDAIDTHAYWQHPRFPGRAWDPEHWFVINRSMVNERGGVLPGLALKRVRGKPHNVTEYNHSAPNTFGSEAFLLLAAYAAFQDWDAIYPFACSHRRDDWDSRRIAGFFDIDQHPTKMVTLVPAMAMFARGDVAPGREAATVALPLEREIDALRGARAWNLVDAATAGMSREMPLLRRVAIAPGADPARAPDAGPAGRSRFETDTGELAWDLTDKSRGVVTVNTPRSKAVIGYGAGKTFALGDVVILPGETMQEGWSAITITAMSPRRYLVTATGYAENTGMGWKTPEKSSVGRDWGEAPSLVEGVSARITLPAPAGRARAWALDERGQRRGEIPVGVVAPRGPATIGIGPEHRTLWYEIEVAP